MTTVTGTPASLTNGPTFHRVARRARCLMLAVAPAAFLATSAHAANLTWDPAQAGTGSDGSGNWDLSSALWSTGTADTLWSNTAGNTAVFGVNGTAGTVTLTDTIIAGGLTFNAATGAYTIAASGTNTLTAPVITVASGQSPTISAPIAGGNGLALSAVSANLTLTGANTYTGTTAVNSGTLTVGAGGSLGAVGNALTIGSGGLATSVQGNLVINNNVTVGSLSATTETTSAAAVVVNTINIGTGFTLTDTGAFTQGIGAVDSNVSNTSMTISGGGTLNISPTNNANFQLGGINANNNNGNSNATLTMTSLGNFIYNTGATGTGNFNVAFGFKSISRLLLAANSTITASTLNVGNSNGGNNGGTSNLTLGTGVNIFNVANIVVGNGKESGTINFPTATTSTLLIDGQAGGGSTANITVGDASSGSGTGTSTLVFSNHTVTAQVNTLIVGLLAGATNGVGTGTVTFDNGTITANSVQLGVASSGSSATAAGPSGTLTIGSSGVGSTATGVLNVTGSFFLANNTLGTSTSNTSTITSKGNFIINAGTVNIGSNIQVAGQATTVLTLTGGTLNMEGFQINGVAAAGQSNTVNLPSGTQTATLENLGGTGINGQGLTTGGGNLILEGNNTYTGTTNVLGNVTVGTGGTTGTLGVGGIILNGSLTFNRSSTYTTSDSINGTGAINQIGTGTIVLAGANGGGGPLNISNGTLVTTGAFGAVTMSSGALHPGTTAGDGSVGMLTVSSLTTTGGDLRFDVGATSDLITVNGPASFTGTTLSVSTAGAVSAGNQTLITSTGLTGLPTLSTTNIGRSTLALVVDGNNIDLDITGGAASLKWNGVNGSTWNANDAGGGVTNFKNGALQDVFFSGDSVTFDDSNTGSDAVTISGSVAPSALAFTGSSQSYTISGGAISGATGLVKSGAANLTLANANTFTGDTTITGGNVTIAAGGAIASTNITVGSGASLTVAAGGDLTAVPNLSDNGTVSLNNPARTLASLSGSGTVNLTGTALTLAGGGTFAGGIQGSGSLIVGGGTVILSGTSGYSGGTSISGGKLQLGAGGTTGSVTGPIAIGGSGILAIDLSGGNVTNAVSGGGSVALIGGTTQIFTGALAYSGLTTLTGGALEVAGANADSIGATAGTGGLIVGDGTSATSLTVNGSGNASGAVTVNAGSTLALAASGSIQANAGVTLNGGTLVAGNASAINNFGSAAVTVTSSGGTIQFTATSVNNGFVNPIALNGNLTFDFNDSGATGRNFTYAGTGGGITGSGNLSITNTGTLGLDTFILSTANPNLTGNILVGNATGAGVRLEVTDPTADANVLGTGAVTVASGSQIWFNQTAPATFNNTFNLAGTGTGQDSPTLGAMRLQTGSVVAGNIHLTGDATISVGSVVSSTATLSGPISGAHALTLKNGIFTLNNSGTASSYGTGVAGSAATVIGPSATAIVGTAGSLSSGGLQLAGGGLNLNGVNLAVNNLSSSATGQTVSVNATTGQTNFVIASTLANVSAGDNISGAGLPANTVILNTATSEAPLFNATVGSPTITVTTAAGLTGLEINDPITGLGIPAGTIITDIEGQTLTLSNNVTAVLANNTASAANVTTGNVIVLSSNLSTPVTNAPLTILDGSVISNNGPAGTSGTATLTVGADNSNQTFNGILVDGTAGGNLALVKNGSGMLALNGANTYTGGTTLNAGTLAGSGSIASTVTAGTAAHAINPGASGANSIGTLTLGGLTTNANTTLAFDLASPAGTSDLLAVTGSLTLAGGNLQVTSQSVTGAASLGYYKVVSYGTLNGSAAGITLPAAANNIAYTLDTIHDPGFIDIHRGYIGDANDDGKVDLSDLNIVLNNLGTTNSSWGKGNFDGAATIDLTDLNDVLNHLGTSIASGSAVAAQATPEPTSLLILGSASLLLARRRRS